jgi:hypothetical protein
MMKLRLFKSVAIRFFANHLNKVLACIVVAIFLDPIAGKNVWSMLEAIWNEIERMELAVLPMISSYGVKTMI